MAARRRLLCGSRNDRHHALLGPSKGSRIGRRRGTSASPPEGLCQDLYDVFIGMATPVVELCAASLSRDHVGRNYCFAHSRAGRLHEFKKSGSSSGFPALVLLPPDATIAATPFGSS